MPTHTPNFCPGPCNNAYRKAEEASATTGEPNHIAPAWGQPIQCWGCVERTRTQLGELPGLLAAVRDEATEGTPTKQTGTIGRVGLHPAWPGQTVRLFLDGVVGSMAELQADLLKLRGLWDDDRQAGPGTTPSEDTRIANIIKTLTAHWDWAMQHHPAASEPHTRGNANPAAQVSGWYWSATFFIKDHHQPEVQRLAPCPRCHGPYLVESRELRLVDDQPYVECRDPDCRRVMTWAEYNTYVKAMTKSIRAAA